MNFSTAEAVGRGHPDKLADQISDAIVDACLKVDPESKVEISALLSKQKVVLAGEISTTAKVDYAKCARQVIHQVGYSSIWGYDPDSLEYITAIAPQSKEISQALIKGAGDSAIVYGMACSETDGYMPLAQKVAWDIMTKREALRNEVDFLGPDGKCQIAILNEKIKHIIFSTQHKSSCTQAELESLLKPKILSCVPKNLLTDQTNLIINPSKQFVIGGPIADTGATGRKIMADSYGAAFPSGGGAFSGKDPTKIDRSGAYAARLAAKHVVASKLSTFCEIWIEFAIGVPTPVSFFLHTRGTGSLPDSTITQAVLKTFDFSVDGIMRMLKLKNCIFSSTAWGGHFGNPQFSWEKLEYIEELLAK